MELAEEPAPRWRYCWLFFLPYVPLLWMKHALCFSALVVLVVAESGAWPHLSPGRLAVEKAAFCALRDFQRKFEKIIQLPCVSSTAPPALGKAEPIRKEGCAGWALAKAAQILHFNATKQSPIPFFPTFISTARNHCPFPSPSPQSSPITGAMPSSQPPIPPVLYRPQPGAYKRGYMARSFPKPKLPQSHPPIHPSITMTKNYDNDEPLSCLLNAIPNTNNTLPTPAR